MSPERIPTETSPLLGEESNALPGSTGALFNTDYHQSPENDLLEQQGRVDAESQQGKDLPLRYIVPAVSIGIFLSAADQTIIMASYGQIGSDLKALNLTSWIATSYFLTLTSFQPLYGKLSDIFGRKACLLFAYAIFGTGSLFCGLSQNIGHLIASRVFQGIGGGGMTTVVSILMSDIVPLQDRGIWQGIINIVYSTGAGIGAPLGGILADYIGWRWAFIAQAPICIIAFITVATVLKLPARENADWKGKLRRIDFLGAFVLIVAVLGVVFGLDRGSNVSWTMPLTVVPLCISVVFFILFILIEVRFAAEPFAPGYIVFNRAFFANYACNFFSFGGWLAALFYIPLYFQAVDGVSATVAGLWLLPSIFSSVSGSLFAGFMIKWTGRYFWLTIAAYGLFILGITGIFIFSGGAVSNTVAMIVSTAPPAFGNGIVVTTTLIALISNSTPEDQAVVTACSYLFRSLGSVLGLSLSSTVVQQALRSHLRSSLHDNKDIDKIVEGVRQSLDFIKKLDPAVAKVVRGSYGWATNKGFAFMVGVAVLGLTSSLFIKEKKIRRQSIS